MTQRKPSSGTDDPQQEQLEQHSLPGINQAGKGPGSREEAGSDRPDKDRVDDVPEPMDEQQKEHSLPGMNQAGKPAAGQG